MKHIHWIIVAILILLPMNVGTVQLALGSSFNRETFPEPPPWSTLFPYLIAAKTILSSVNAILLTILLLTYLGIYQKTRSEFSLGLIIFTLALLLYAITANPLIQRVAGFRLSGLGPFTMLPDLFTCIASAILLFLSQQ